MKRSLLIALALLLFAGTATAQSLLMGENQVLPDDILIRIDSAEILSEWEGNSSDTHKWIVIGFTLGNMRHENFDAKNQMTAQMIYPEDYQFLAETIVTPEVFEPLVSAQGEFVFRVPNLVAQSEPGLLKFSLSVEKKTYSLPVVYKRYALAGEEIFFETPEDAVLYFYEHLTSNDFSGILKATAGESMAERYDLNAYIKRIGVLTPAASMPYPVTPQNDYLPLNRIMGKAQVVRQLYGFLSSLLIGPYYDVSRSYSAKEGELKFSETFHVPIEEFTELFNPDRLHGLRLLYITELNSDQFNSERNQENIAKQGAVFGYSQQKEMLGIYSFEGKEYVHGYTVVRFERGWQIHYLNAIFFGTSFTGEAIAGDQDTIDSILNGGDYLIWYKNP